MSPAAVDFVLHDLRAAEGQGDVAEAVRLLTLLVEALFDDFGTVTEQIERVNRGEPIQHGKLAEAVAYTHMRRVQQAEAVAARRRAGAGALNVEKRRTAADRQALGRRLYVPGMSGEALRRAYAREGEVVSPRTAERDLKKIRT